MQSLLEVDSVAKSYNDSRILTDIYLTCKTGEIVGLLGRNGSGKSTLLKTIFGILPAESKFIRIDGVVYSQPYKKRDLLCYLPQHDFLPKYMSVEKIVKLSKNNKEAKIFLEDTILDKIVKTRVSNLSSGELRYLETKLLLNTDCKFLLLDEPFNGVSPIVISCIKKIIKEASKNKGIILTDHDYRNVLDLCNCYWLLIDGGIKEIKRKNDFVKWGYIPKDGI